MGDPQTTKMLQAILDGQRAIKEELKGEIQKNRQAIQETKETLTERIDRLGLQLAQLSDDVPTVEEFDELKEQVAILRNQFTKN